MTLFTRISEGNPGSDWKQFVGSNKSSDVTKFLCPLFVSFFILSLQRAESSLLLKAAGVINKSLARVGILDSFAAMDGLKFMTDRVFIWSRGIRNFAFVGWSIWTTNQNLGDAWYTAITMSDMIRLTHTTCCYTATLIHIWKLTSYLFFWLNDLNAIRRFFF